MAERLNAPVLKTGMSERASRVRISLPPQSLAHDLSWAFTLRKGSNAEHCERDSNAGAGEFGLEPKRKVGARRGETGMRDFSVEKYFWPSC